MNRLDGAVKAIKWIMVFMLVAVATGCNSSDPILGGNIASSSSAKAITDFSLAGISGTINPGTINEPAKTIAVTVPYGTDLTDLKAAFTSTGVNVKVGSAIQLSTVTSNNFIGTVSYIVTAANGTTATYLVTVTVAPNTAKAITAYSLAGIVGTINELAKTIAVTVPYGTDVTALVATYIRTGVNVKVGTAVQVSATTANDFSSPVSYTVTAANSTTATYVVTVTVALNTAKAITAYSFAGYTGATGIINESAKTIAVTVPYGTDVTSLVATYTRTGVSVKVGTTVQVSATTANNFSSPVAYTVTAASGATAIYLVTVTIAPNTARAITAYSFAGYTGATGIINESAKTIAVTVPFGTDVTDLIATFTSTGVNVKVGTVIQTSTATTNNFSSPVSYTVTAASGATATYLVTVTIAPNTARAITAYSFVGYTGATGIINETAKTIAVTVPFGTDVTDLVATFTSTGVNVKVGAVIQTSTATANNFSSPVSYTVTAASGATATYLVTVTIAPNTAKAITAYSFAGYTGAAGIINETAKTIAVTVPFGTDVTDLVATFTSTGVNVKVGAVIQTSTATANNFSSPVAYIVTAEDTTTATYIVTVTIAPSTAKAITAYSFAGYPGATGVIDEPVKTIAVTVPYGTDVTGLIATFTSTGVNVKVGAVIQTSTATVNDFSSPVAYIVTAEDTTTATYTVTVAIAPGPDLRRAASFALLAGTSITNAGSTSVTGDVGATGVTGTAPAVTGNYYPIGSETAYVDAKADLALVIGDVNNTVLFPCGTNISGALGTASLTPGIYCISADAAISGVVNLTLNGAGVYIFRTTGALTPAATSTVALGGTATDATTHVFWAVGSASLGTSSVWKGSILTGGAITLDDSVTLLNGRALSTAAVTLTNNTIVVP